MSKNLAEKVWSVVKNPQKVNQLSLGVQLNKVVREANSLVPLVTETTIRRPPEEILKVAKFIANAEVSFLNPVGQEVHLKHMRMFDYSNEETFNQVQIIVDYIYEVVAPFIVVTKEGEEKLNHKLKVRSKLPKKAVVHRAIRHLLTGSEVTTPETHQMIKIHSLLAGGYISDYLSLAAIAKGLSFNSVNEMMDTFVLGFQDQEESIKEHGLLTFYEENVTKVPIGG